MRIIRKKVLCLLISLIGIATAANGQGKPIEFVEYDLDNGLHVILHRDNSTPIVDIGVMYHVGAKNEKPNRTGLAHFFEHLLFEGTENIDRGAYDKIILGAGGHLNAYTTQDYTYYYETLPANQLELGLYMESERLLHAKVDLVGVETQRKVVKEEKRERYDNRPYGSVWIEIFKRAFQHHPYQWAAIGSMEHLDAATLEEFMAFYKTYYVPNNATLTIAGAIDIANTKALVEKYFGEIPRGTTPIYRPQIKEPPLKGQIVDTVYDFIELPAVYQAYRIPEMESRDSYALTMLAMLLGQGESSWLHKTLVDQQQVALQVNVFPYFLEDEGLLIVLGIANTSVNINTVSSAIDTAIEKVKAQLITEKTLQKLQNQMENDLVNARSSMHHIAEALSLNHVFFNNTNLINTEIDEYRKIDAAAIQRIAQKYLRKENRVMLYYLPHSKQ